MEDLILSRIDYAMLVLFVVAVVFSVLFIAAKQSKPLVEHPVQSLVATVKAQPTERVIACGVVAALLGFFIVVTLLAAHPSSERTSSGG